MTGRCTWFGRGGMIRAVVCLLSVLGVGRAVSAEDVSAHVHFTAANARTTLDRSTGLLTSTVDVTLWNLGGKTLLAPLHVVVDLTSDQVQMPGALGGPGDPLYGAHYLDLSPTLADGRLKAGAGVSFVLTLVRNRSVDFTYAIRCFAPVDPGRPPELTVDPTGYTVEEGASLSIRVTAVDPDGDIVTLSAAPVPAGSSFAATSGVQAAGTLVFASSRGQRGVYQVALRAVDPGGLADSEMVEVTVVPVNRPPTVAVPASAGVREGDVISIPITAEDPDGDPLTVEAVPLPANSALIEASRTITFAPDFDQAGVYDIACRSSDGALTSTASVVRVTVQDVPPAGATNQLVLVVDPVESPSLLATVPISGTVNAAATQAPRYARTSSLITGLLPADGRQGQTLDVELLGQGAGRFATHFVAGGSQADFGPGITVNSLVVSSASQAVARISIAAEGAPGLRAVQMRTGAETAISIPAFHVREGLAEVTGRAVDQETGLPIAGAIVTIQGLGITAVTDADGNFTLTGVPPGDYLLLLNPPDHEILVRAIGVELGGPTALGELASAPTVLNLRDAAPVSLAGVIRDGVCVRGRVKRSYNQAQAMVQNTLLLCGGSEVGFFDAWGQQQNPEVDGDGLLSLGADAIRMLAQQVERNDDSVSLMELLFAVSWGLRWEGNRFPDLAEWIQALQDMVDLAWADPHLPENRMVILIFNSGRALPPAPPVLSAETRLNSLQQFLFMSSFLVAAYTPQYTPGWPYAWLELEIDSPWRSLRDTLEALTVGTACAAPPEDPPETNTVNRIYTQYWRGFFEQKNQFLVGSENGPSRATAAFTVALTHTAALPLGGAVGAVAGARAYGPVAELLMGIYGSYTHAANLPQPPPASRMGAEVTVSNKQVSVDIRFPLSSSHVLTGSTGSFAQQYIYVLYRFKGPDQPREMIKAMLVDGDTPVELDRPMTLKGVNTPEEWALLREYRLTIRDRDPLPMVEDDHGQLVPAANATWFYAMTVTRINNVASDDKFYPLSLTAPWWSALLTEDSSPYTAYLRRRNVQTSDYSDPILVRLDSQGAIVYDTYELELHPSNNVAYVAEPMQAGNPEKPGRIITVSDGGEGIHGLLAPTGFAAPGHRGLAIDSLGYLYSENSASDAMYGGRVFSYNTDPGPYYPSGLPIDLVDLFDPRESLPAGGRSYAGTINYFSPALMYARPTAAGPIAMGPGIPESTNTSAEALYVLDEVDEQVKKIPVQAFGWAPERRTGKLFARMPFAATGQDMEVLPSGSAQLLVQGIPSLRLEVEMDVPDEVAIGREFEIVITVRNPSPASFSDVELVFLDYDGEGDVVSLQVPQPSVATLGPYAEATFTSRYQAVSSGEVVFRAQAKGNAPGSGGAPETISSDFGYSDPLRVGTSLEIVAVLVENNRVAVDEEFEIEVIVKDRGGGGVSQVSLATTDDQRLISEPFGEVEILRGPSPALADLAPFDVQSFTLTCRARTLGWVNFLQHANGIDDVSGKPVDAKHLGPVILVTPLDVAADIEPDWIPFTSNQTMSATITVSNRGATTVYNVEAGWDFSRPAFSNIVAAGEPVTLAPRQSHEFTFTFEEPIEPGGYEGNPVVTAESAAGDPIPAQGPAQFFSIGPVVQGRILDVNLVMELDRELPFLGAHPVEEGLQPVSNVYVHIAGQADPEFETYTDADGKFVLPLPDDQVLGITVEGIHFSSNIGFREYDFEVGPEVAVTNVIYLPVSLVQTTTNLVNDHHLMEFKTGELPFPLPDVFNMLTNSNLAVDLPDLISKDVNGLATMQKVADGLTLFLDHHIRKGMDAPSYIPLGERDGMTAVNEWDALLRLDTLAGFNLRRYKDAAALNASGAGMLAGFFTTLLGVQEGVANAQNAHITTTHPDLEPDEPDEALLGRVEIVSKVTNFVLSEFIRTKHLEHLDEATRKYIISGFFLLEEMSKLVGAVRGLDISGIAEDSVKLAFQATGMAILQPFYQSMAESSVYNAIQRADQGEIRGGSTLKIIQELGEFDALISPITEANLALANAGKETYEGLDGLAENFQPYLLPETKFQEVNIIVLTHRYCPEGELVVQAQEKAELATPFGKALNTFLGAVKPALQYYRLYKAGQALLEAHFLVSGRLAVAADHVIDPEPRFAEMLRDPELMDTMVLQEYAKLWGLE